MVNTTLRWGGWDIPLYTYYRGCGFLAPFGLKPFRFEIGLGVNVPKSWSGIFFLSDTNVFVIIRVLKSGLGLKKVEKITYFGVK